MNRCMAVTGLIFLVACTPANKEPTFAVPIQSAIVEYRDGVTERELNTPTQVVILGTGTPIPDPRRAGPSVAVIHRGQSYLFDIGAGSIQNAVTARYLHDIPSLYPTHICCVFITHMHSDHTLDLVELAYRMWWRRPHRLRVFGPTGVDHMVGKMEEMMGPDLRIRLAGTQPVQFPESRRAVATEISDGVVLEKEGLKIEAFSVPHGAISPAYAYKVTAHDRTIVISGDTSLSEKLEEMATGVDVLVHEVISDQGLLKNSPAFQKYHKASHTLAS
ncbi:MAG: MBL fold metallo-hydrolase, partial [Pseudomonadota bacterium]